MNLSLACLTKDLRLVDIATILRANVTVNRQVVNTSPVSLSMT